MTVPATTLSLTGDGPESRASADELLALASGDDGLIRANRIRSVKDGKFRFITADALREYVRTLERNYEEAS